MSITPRTTDEPNPNDGIPTATNHARQRYRQRINHLEPDPGARLRDLFRVAELEGDHPRVSDGLAWVAGDAILVTDSNREAITTVLRRWEGR